MAFRRVCLCGKTGVRPRSNVKGSVPTAPAPLHIHHHGAGAGALGAAAATPGAACYRFRADEVDVFGGHDVMRYHGRVFCRVCGEHIARERNTGAGTPAIHVEVEGPFEDDETLRIRDVLRRIAPPLDGSRHKGQGGRIGVLGGSDVYTGAPFFSGMSALRVGAELVYLLVPSEAAPVIKSYSPELMVTPLFSHASGDLSHLGSADHPKFLEVGNLLEGVVPRLQALVVGPGLGTAEGVPDLLLLLLAVVDESFQEPGRQIPVVVDADGLRALATSDRLRNSLRDLSASGKICLALTPNARELGIVADACLGGSGDARVPNDAESSAKLIAKDLRCIVVLKGAEDLIVSPAGNTYRCSVEGCPRRVGGLGDFLSGSLALLLGWRFAECSGDTSEALTLGACHAACGLVRRAAHSAFAQKKRAMSTQDVMDMMGPVTEELCPAHL